MKQRYFEFFVGIFLVLGIFCLAVLSLRVARNDFFAGSGYEIYAMFKNSAGLRSGASVQIAGVEVGRIKSIVLEDYQAKITFTIHGGVEVQKDSFVSIKTKGLIGEKFVEIDPGGDDPIAAGGRLLNTEEAIDIERLISQFIHGNVSSSDNKSADKSDEE